MQHRRIGMCVLLTAPVLAVGGLIAAQSEDRMEGKQPVKVTVGERLVLRKAETLNWFPNIHRMANGNLIASCQTAPDETNPQGTEVARRFLSTDNGTTWQELGPYDTGGPCSLTLRDGTYLGIWFYNQRKDDGWVTKTVRSIDHGLTYRDNYSSKVALLS